MQSVPKTSQNTMLASSASRLRNLNRPGVINSSTVPGTCSNGPRTIPASSFGRWATRAAGVPTSPPVPMPCGVGIRNEDPYSTKERNTMEMPCSSAEMGKAGAAKPEKVGGIIYPGPFFASCLVLKDQIGSNWHN